MRGCRHIPKVGIRFRTTGIPKEWAGLGEMITRKTFKQRIFGAMKKKDRPEWMTDGPGHSAGSCDPAHATDRLGSY